MVIVKKLLIIAALVGVVLWAVPEASVEGQIGYQVTEAQLAAAFPLTTNTVLSTDNTTLAFGTDSDAVVSWQTAGTYLLWNITQAGGSLIAWQDSGASVVLSLSDVSSTVGYDILDLASNLGTMNGSDTVRGLFVDLTNADHTGSGNLLYGIDVDGITGDADASEYALHIGDGWDAAIFMEESATAGITATDGASIDIYTGASDTILSIDDQGRSGTGVRVQTAWLVMDGSDSQVGLEVYLAHGDHGGSGNTQSAIQVTDITGDAESNDVIFRLGDNYDYLIDDVTDTALGTLTWTTNSDKTGNNNVGTLKVYINGTLYHLQLYADS